MGPSHTGWHQKGCCKAGKAVPIPTATRSDVSGVHPGFPKQACSGVFLRPWSWQRGPGARRSLILLPRAEHAKAGGARLAGACRQEQLPLWCSRFLLKLGHCLASPPRSVGNVIAPWAAKSEHAGRETRARERGEARPRVIWEVQRIRESLPIPTHSPRACYNSALPGFLPPPGMTDPDHAGSGRRGFGELCSVSWGREVCRALSWEIHPLGHHEVLSNSEVFSNLEVTEPCVAAVCHGHQHLQEKPGCAPAQWGPTSVLSPLWEERAQEGDFCEGPASLRAVPHWKAGECPSPAPPGPLGGHRFGKAVQRRS